MEASDPPWWALKGNSQKKKKKKIKNNNTETCYSGSATVVFTSIPQNWTTAFIMSPVQ